MSLFCECGSKNWNPLFRVKCPGNIPVGYETLPLWSWAENILLKLLNRFDIDGNWKGGGGDRFLGHHKLRPSVGPVLTIRPEYVSAQGQDVRVSGGQSLCISLPTRFLSNF